MMKGFYFRLNYHFNVNTSETRRGLLHKMTHRRRETHQSILCNEKHQANNLKTNCSSDRQTNSSPYRIFSACMSLCRSVHSYKWRTGVSPQSVQGITQHMPYNSCLFILKISYTYQNTYPAICQTSKMRTTTHINKYWEVVQNIEVCLYRPSHASRGSPDCILK